MTTTIYLLDGNVWEVNLSHRELTDTISRGIRDGNPAIYVPLKDDYSLNPFMATIFIDKIVTYGSHDEVS